MIDPLPGTRSSQPNPELALLEILHRVAERDEAAMEELYDRTRRRVFGLALKVCRDRDLAEEATLDAYTQVWRTAREYRPSKGSVIAWLLMLARTRAIDRRRAAGARAPLDVTEFAADLETCAPGPEELSQEAERAQSVRAAMAELPEEQRAAIQAAFFGGLSHSAVATALNVPLGTIKTRIRTGMATLRRVLAENGNQR